GGSPGRRLARDAPHLLGAGTGRSGGAPGPLGRGHGAGGRPGACRTARRSRARLVKRLLEVLDVGRQGYLETLEQQRTIRLDRLAGRIDHDVLLLVEHPPVYTLGRGTRESSLPIAPALLRQRGAE